MSFKLVVAMTEVDLSDRAIEAARDNGATGCTVITHARGQGLTPTKTFLGLNLESQRDIILFLVKAQHGREILEAIATACGFSGGSGSGVGFIVDIEDAIGLRDLIEGTEHKSGAAEQ